MHETALAWQPDQPVRLVAGTPPGGGLDRVARAIAKAITQGSLIPVPLEVVNVPGGGARRAWTHYVDDHPGDGHILGVSSPNLTTDYLIGAASFDHSKYVPIATLITEYIAFAVRSDSDMNTGADLLARLAHAASSMTVALSTARGNPNHIALAKLARLSGADVSAPIVRVFDSAVDAVAGVVTGGAHVCAVTAASVLSELNAGQLRVLGISAPERLAGPLAAVPTWKEQSADCTVGAWRGITGASGITPQQTAYWARVLEAATQQPVWRQELSRLNWSSMLLTGTVLREYLDVERAEFIVTLGELGLLGSFAAG